jgi:hypothetical protein
MFVMATLEEGNAGGNTSQISQLHRVALLLPENQEFMSLCNDSVTTLPHVSGGSILRGGVLSQGLFEVDEMSIWTLCSVGERDSILHSEIDLLLMGCGTQKQIRQSTRFISHITLGCPFTRCTGSPELTR